MRSSVYYPHTTVSSESIVKTALLLWDHLEFIVPHAGFKPHYQNRTIARAMELIGLPHPPNQEEKSETHTRIEELLRRRLPPQVYYRRHKDFHNQYEIYPEKFLPETWELLLSNRMSGRLMRNLDYPMSEPGGLIIMSILADSCAGSTRSRITDRTDAYATLAGFLGDVAHAPPVDRSEAYAALVPLSIEVLDAPKMSLKSLIELREREAKESGHTLRDLRHRYVDSLETYVARLTQEKVRKADAKEIQRQFADDMKIDFKKLKDELGFAGRSNLFSKEILITALAVGGSVASWAFDFPIHFPGEMLLGGIPVTIWGLLRAGNKYFGARRAVLEKHPMAYLYEAQA
jgi:hypothetical protein